MQTRTPVSRVAYSALATAAFALICPLAESAQAQLSPNGIEFQVNTYTTGRQWRSSVAGLGSNGFVVVWGSAGSGGSDTDGWSVQAQRIGLDGALLGEQFQVNSSTTGSQSYPRVASDGSSNFIVVWESAFSAGTDSSATSIQGRRFSSSGIPLSDEFQVNTYTNYHQKRPAIEIASGGEFVVVWGSSGSGPPWENTSVEAQRFSATAEPLGSEFQVNSFSGSNLVAAPDIALLDGGGFVVAWSSDGSPGSDQDESSTQARIFDANADAAGPQFQVNTQDSHSQRAPSVASLSGGGFVIAWDSYYFCGANCYQSLLSMQRFDSAGGTLGGETSFDLSHGWRPRVKSVPSGDFVVAWARVDLDPWQPRYPPHVRARRYSVDGTPRTEALQVSSFTLASQQDPSLAVDDSGNFLIAWSSLGAPGTDSSDTSIVARRIAGLFRDGFETGGLIRWSMTAP